MRTPCVPVLGALAVCAGVVVVVGQATPRNQAPAFPAKAMAPMANETHLANIRQLTFGGENADAYFLFDGTRLSFQSARGANACHQIYSMNIDGSDVKHISNGGRTTCSYYTPDGKKFVFASHRNDAKDGETNVFIADWK